MSLRRGAINSALLLFGAMALITPNASGDSPTLPIYNGQTFPKIQQPSDPEDYSWQVELAPEQSLKLIDDQHAMVEYEDGHPAFEIVASKAHDAIGTSVPTTIAVSEGDVLTLTVHHRAGNPAAGGAPFSYPITAGEGWEGGFKTEIIQGPKDEQELREEREASRRRSPVGPKTGSSSAQGHIRYAGHVRFTHTSCCGFNEVVFKAFGRRHVHYRVCVRRPGGVKRCKHGVTGESGEPSKKQFASTRVGVYRATWSVSGHIVDRSHWTNSPEGV